MKAAFNDSWPKKGGVWDIIDETQHDVTDDVAAFQLADLPSPPANSASIYDVDRPTKNALEQKWIDDTQAKLGGVSAQRHPHGSASRRCGDAHLASCLDERPSLTAGSFFFTA
jgi:hypothetical protein